MNKYDNSMQICKSIYSIYSIYRLEGNHMLPETKNREPIVSWNGPDEEVILDTAQMGELGYFQYLLIIYHWYITCPFFCPIQLELMHAYA